MNQYFAVRPTAGHRYTMVPGISMDTESHGYATYREARRAANYHGGYVVKNYTEDDYKRDYEREAV